MIRRCLVRLTVTMIVSSYLSCPFRKLVCMVTKPFGTRGLAGLGSELNNYYLYPMYVFFF